MGKSVGRGSPTTVFQLQNSVNKLYHQNPDMFWYSFNKLVLHFALVKPTALILSPTKPSSPDNTSAGCAHCSFMLSVFFTKLMQETIHNNFESKFRFSFYFIRPHLQLFHNLGNSCTNIIHSLYNCVITLPHFIRIVTSLVVLATWYQWKSSRPRNHV